ncbi:transposase [Arcobacter sp. HD9-500m-PIT-SAG03]|nr:transposase [Arcobacter sp. HD9-500m-PIT-SAG03]
MRKSKYSKEFKDSTVQLILNNNESVVQVAADLDLNPKTLYHWVTVYKKEHNIPTRDVNLSSSKESEHEELKRLRRENKILKQERDILKKATAYFAKETL